MKIHELAKELEMSSKDVLQKVQSMGIEAKTHMSALTDIDAKAVRNTLLKGKKGSETKIVKVAPKKAEKEAKLEDEPRVTVKAANIKPAAQSKGVKTAQSKPEEKVITQKPPVGKPVVPKDMSNRVKPPVGKPMAKDSEEIAKAKKVEGQKAKEKEAGKTDKKQTRPTRQYVPRQEFKIVSKAPTPEEKAAAEKKAAEKRAADKKIADERRAAAAKDRNQRDDRSRSDRPQDRNKSDRPQDRNGSRDSSRDSSRPPRRDGPSAGARPQRSGSTSGPSAPTGIDKPVNKKQQNRPKNKSKDKDRYSKTDSRSKAQPVRSLEKQKRPKRHNSKPKVVIEPVVEVEELPVGTKVVNVPITVAGLSEQIQVSVSKIIMTLMKMGIISNVNQNMDEDVVLLLGEELGVNIIIGNVEEEEVEEGLETFEDKEAELKSRPPIITVMGHVDHGKTSLLDAIRKTNVTASESGGITQHIGASEVEIKGQKIVFLDTPGHEAFTAMRARGAHTTDIAILVVAADDSVKPQTIESISHAKAAGVPIIVAMNKMDKPGANPDTVKKDLADHEILVEDWGGDVICVPVSAKTGEGIVSLLEMILLQAEVLELRANPSRLALGTVLEARLDKAKGPVASLLVLNGTLKAGMSIVAGTSSGKIRLMTNHKGEKIRQAGPATAVEILGLTDVPHAGDEFNAVKEDKAARDIAEHRQNKKREEVLLRNSSTTLEELFGQIEEGEKKELNLIIKGDVQGSVGAVTASLEKLTKENVTVKVIHTGVGAVTESDIMLARTSESIIIGFNVRPSTAVAAMADRDGIQIRTYRVIYDIIDDIENAMKGMLDPEFKEVVLGTVEVRETFKVPGIGIIGGAYVTDGKILRNASVRLVRDGIVIHEGKISSLKRFKDDAKEVAHGFECGIGIENYNDIKEGDIIECFHMEEIERD
ncbi:MAG: translation initiation factor IF-2 [Anaerovoracaceae bacterium]